MYYYAHGFGVRKEDGKNLFVDVSEGLPGAHHVLTDLNDCEDEPGVTVQSLQFQADRLRTAYDKAKKRWPDATIDAIAHSQGCIVAGIAQLPGVRKTIFLAPPSESGSAGIEKLFHGSDARLDIHGMSHRINSNGTKTHVMPEYWESLRSANLMELYRDLGTRTQLHILNARDEEILGPVDFTPLGDASATVQIIPGDHNFTGISRAGLSRVMSEHFD